MFGRKSKKVEKKIAVDIKPSRRRARKESKQNVDPLGGFSVDQLFGIDPVSSPSKGKGAGVASGLLALPVALLKLPITLIANLASGIVQALAEVLRLPIRVLSAIFKPWKKAAE